MREGNQVNPLLFRWEGDAFKPIQRHAKECDKRYVIGEHYALEEIQERSSKSHAHYFACVGQAWANLREDVAEQFPTAEHLRKFALIKAGYFDSRTIVAKSKAEALRLAAFIRPMDEFAIVTADNMVVTVYTAKSQNHRSMHRTQFAKSKEAVLAILATMIDVAPAALERAGTE
jgi:hypothetical protein